MLQTETQAWKAAGAAGDKLAAAYRAKKSRETLERIGKRMAKQFKASCAECDTPSGWWHGMTVEHDYIKCDWNEDRITIVMPDGEWLQWFESEL